MAVGDVHVFPGFLTPVLTQLFFSPKKKNNKMHIKPSGLNIHWERLVERILMSMYNVRFGRELKAGDRHLQSGDLFYVLDWSRVNVFQHNPDL